MLSFVEIADEGRMVSGFAQMAAWRNVLPLIRGCDVLLFTKQDR